MRLDKRWWFLIGVAGLLALFFAFDLNRLLTLVVVKSSQADLETWCASRPALAGLIFVVGFLVLTALSLPAAVLVSMAAGPSGRSLEDIAPERRRPDRAARASQDRFDPLSNWRGQVTCR